jgi:hypothetical protein
MMRPAGTSKGVLAAPALLLGLAWGDSLAHGAMITIDAKGILGANNKFGVPDATIQGVVDEAKRIWEALLPDDPNKPKDDPQNAHITIALLAGMPGGGGVAQTIIPGNLDHPETGQGLSVTIINNTPNFTGTMFWDPTPRDNSEFTMTTPGRFTALEKLPNGDPGPAFGKFDMLTVLLHEFGHVLGFAGYSEFNDYVENTWNQGSGTKIDLKSSHFVGGSNLMTGAAGFPGGKGGRSFPQPEDLAVLSGAYDYAFTAPEPSTLGLLSLGGAALLGYSRKLRKKGGIADSWRVEAS